MQLKIVLITFCLLLIATPFLFSQVREEDVFSQYEGKTIRNVYIKVLDIAGASLQSGQEHDTSWLGKIANALHVKTKEWVVRERLLFREGDMVEPRLMSESERLLRTSGPFVDAIISIAPADSSNNDSVDVFVTTKDKWTLALLASYNADTRNSYFGIKDDNTLGFGHAIDLKISHDQDSRIGLGADLKYLAPNVMGSYTDVEFDLLTNRKTSQQALSFTRSFISTETDWAGGADFLFNKSTMDYYTPDNIPVSTPFKYNSQDLWVGRSFHFGLGPEYFRKNSKVAAAVRILNKDYSSRPLVTPTYNRIFEKGVILLGSLGFINQRFYKDVYIRNFGITEDVPVGGILQVTAGVDKGEFFSRNYLGTEAVYSRRIQDIGYMSGRLAVGGFRNGNRWEQNLINANLIYHTSLYKLDNWFFRGFVQNDITLGYNRFTGEVIYLDTETGLRGIKKYLLYGTKRETLNLEGRFFSPYKLYGFVLGGSIFADFGIIGNRDKSLVNNQLYQGYGFSLRTRNESIARADIEVAFVYNPVHPEAPKGLFSVLIKTSIVMGIRDFMIGKPEIFEFGDN